jgi:hypothetical protein
VATPASILNIGTGAGQNYFSAQVAPDTGGVVVEHTLSELLGGYDEAPYFTAVGTSPQAVQFRARLDAPTTSGSATSRCELREQNADGTDAAWDANSGTHVMHGRTTITHLPATTPAVVIAQVFNTAAGADRVSIRTQLVSGTPRLRIRINGVTATLDAGGTDLLAGLAAIVGVEFEWKIDIVDGTVKVYFNNMVTPVLTSVGQMAANGAVCYFKAGCYNQASTATGDSATDYGSAQLRDLQVSHTATPAAPAAVSWRTPAATATADPGASQVVNKPTGAAQGDYLIAIIWQDFDANGDIAQITAPAGWAQIGSNIPPVSGDTSPTGKVFAKFAGPSEPTNYTFHLAPDSAVIHLFALTGVDATTPLRLSPVLGGSKSNPMTTGTAFASGAGQQTGDLVVASFAQQGGTVTYSAASMTGATMLANASTGWVSGVTGVTGVTGTSAIGAVTYPFANKNGSWRSVTFVVSQVTSIDLAGAATATMLLAATVVGGKNAPSVSTAPLLLSASAGGVKSAAGSSSATALRLSASPTGSRSTGGSPNAATMKLSASATGQVINAVTAVLRLSAVLTATGRPGAGAATATLRLIASATAAPRDAANSVSALPLHLAASAGGAGGHLGAPSAALLRLQAAATGIMQAQGSPAATLHLSASASGVHAGVGSRTAALRLLADTSGNTRVTTGVTVAATVRLLAATVATSTRQNATSATPLRLFATLTGQRVITAIATQILTRPAPTTTYELVAVARVQQPSGPPVYLQVDPIDWTGLSYTEELSKVPQLNVGCQITGLTEPILQRLRKPAELPTELWLYRNGKLVFSGPLVTGQVQNQSMTLNAQGALGYLRLMDVVADMVFSQVDQFAITTALIDQWQTLPYGNFGIDTAGIAPSGVKRDATYLQKELHNVGQRVEELGLRDNGFDIWVDPSSRKLQLAYPQRGVDRSTGEDAIVFDERNIVSPNIMFSVAPGDVASEAFGTGTGDSTIYSTKSNTDLRAQYGRSGVTGTFDGVSDQATLDDHVQGLLDPRATALLVPGPDVRVTPDSDISAYDVGDTVSYTMHNLLSVASSFRLRSRTVTVSTTGQEAVSVAFV